MKTIAFYSPCFCLSNRVWHGQIISCTVVIYPNYFKCLGTIFAIFLLQKTHYFLEWTHQILTPSNVSAARCRLLLLSNLAWMMALASRLHYFDWICLWPWPWIFKIKPYIGHNLRIQLTWNQSVTNYLGVMFHILTWPWLTLTLNIQGQTFKLTSSKRSVPQIKSKMSCLDTMSQWYNFDIARDFTYDLDRESSRSNLKWPYMCLQNGWSD